MGASAQIDMTEKRSYRRISDAVALYIEIVDPAVANSARFELPELPDHPTHVVNLSPSGLKCYHSEPFNDQDSVALSMMLFPEQTRLELQATVVNYGELPSGGQKDRFFAGLAFKNLSDESRDILLQHIDSIVRRSFGGAVKLVYKA
ncbi:hypothetical protein AB833_14090 [Chromatiales bacterium (ex Bugula neritina AB1)]|nr:hypothetical protein AB833_14090 [Chromatiales bacterium (ex Bugula neritina AB1)]